MEINYRDIAQAAVEYAGKSGIELDYSKKSIEKVELILGEYHENLGQYEGEAGADTLWNIAVHFGIYLGETLLRLKLEAAGYEWYVEESLPLLKNENNEISPITKAHKRILYGDEDNVKSFCDVAFVIAEGGFPTENINRVVDVELPSGQKIENVLKREIGEYISLVEKGEEDFLILESYDGYLQFYGVDNQYIAELRMNLKDDDFCTYSMINMEKEHMTTRVQLVTPYGEYTPTEWEIISLDLLKAVVRKYYENNNTDELLKLIPVVDTTEEMKRCMGLID